MGEAPARAQALDVLLLLPRGSWDGTEWGEDTGFSSSRRGPEARTARPQPHRGGSKAPTAVSFPAAPQSSLPVST